MRSEYETDFVALNSRRMENENLSERVNYRFVPGMTGEERSEIMIELSHYAKIGSLFSRYDLHICTQTSEDEVGLNVLSIPFKRRDLENRIDTNEDFENDRKTQNGTVILTRH